MTKFFKLHHNMEFQTGRRFENFISEIVLSYTNPGIQSIPIDNVCGGKYCRVGTTYNLSHQYHVYDQFNTCDCGIPAVPTTNNCVTSSNIILECPKNSLTKVKTILGIPKDSSIPCKYYLDIGRQTWSCPENTISLLCKSEIKWILDRPEADPPKPSKSSKIREKERPLKELCREERFPRNTIIQEETQNFNQIFIYLKKEHDRINYIRDITITRINALIQSELVRRKSIENDESKLIPDIKFYERAEFKKIKDLYDRYINNTDLFIRDRYKVRFNIINEEDAMFEYIIRDMMTDEYRKEIRINKIKRIVEDRGRVQYMILNEENKSFSYIMENMKYNEFMMTDKYKEPKLPMNEINRIHDRELKIKEMRIRAATIKVSLWGEKKRYY